MKMSHNLLTVLRAMSMVDGMNDEINEDRTTTKTVSIIWLNDWFKSGKGYYYMGFDKDTKSYFVEWRGKLRTNPEIGICHDHVITVSTNGYVIPTAELILKAIKNHKQYVKDNKETW